ncbi:MAG: VOC family protein [Limisphaerales bacterium]
MNLPKFSAEHFGLAARDPVALKDWYMRVLGARLVFDNGGAPPAFFLALPGSLLIEVYQAGSVIARTGDNRLAGWRHLALRVEALEPARDDLAARGVTFDEPIKPAGGGGRVLFFADPEGNLLHLIERPANSIFSRDNS